MSPELILVRGGSGTGKTLLLRELRAFHVGGSSIDTDNIRDLVNSHDWMDPASYRMCLTAVAEIARCHLEQQVRPVTIADTFALPVLRSFLTTVQSFRRAAVVSLYARGTTTTARMSERDGRHLIPAALHNSLTQNAELRPVGRGLCSVDTDDLSVAQVRDAVLGELAHIENTPEGAPSVGYLQQAIEPYVVT